MLHKVVTKLSFLLFFICLSNCEEIKVKTKYGTFIGDLLKARNGRNIYAYQGIPFAKPPVGPLRFQEAQPLEESESVFLAKQPGNDCLQESFDVSNNTDSELVMEIGTRYTGSEDCLYLNIYVPEVKSKGKKLPVMFFIHGGGFVLGSGSQQFNGPQIFLERDFIMVAPNYRLSVLGFLSSIEDIPENLGLKDQYFALKWVKENIGDFGGDMDSITLAGLSAGSASVTFHHHSRLSKGLFKGGIAQSGTLFNPWALRSRREAQRTASKIINYLGCSSKPKHTSKCLRKMPVEQLFDAVKSLQKLKLGFQMPIGPVIEEESATAFITQESLRHGSTAPMIAGMANEESIGFFKQMEADDAKFSDLSRLKADYAEILPIVLYYPELKNKGEVTSAVSKFYVNDNWSKDNVNKFIQLLSDRQFNHGLHVLARTYKGKLYQYLWSYTSKYTIFGFPNPPGLENSTSHGADMPFLIPNEYLPVPPLKGEELKFSNYVLDLWTNFILNGNPTPDSKFWKESNGGVNYIEFKNDGHSMKTNMFKERMEFMDTLKFDVLESVHDEL